LAYEPPTNYLPLLLLGLALSDVAADEGLLGVQGFRDGGGGIFYFTFQMSNSKYPSFLWVSFSKEF
jgi:hypothetical protein